MKMVSIINLILITLIGCTKTEVESFGNLDILGDQIEIVYDTSYTSSYCILDYQATGLMRVFWSSTDSFQVVLFNDTINRSVVDFSTYTRDNGTGCQLVYFNKTHIGDTLDIYATAGELRDSIKLIIK